MREKDSIVTVYTGRISRLTSSRTHTNDETAVCSSSNSNNHNFNFVDIQTVKEEITLTDSDSSIDVCDNVTCKKRSSVIAEVTLDSDNDLLIICDSDLEDLSEDVCKIVENASTDTTPQSTITVGLCRSAEMQPIMNTMMQPPTTDTSTVQSTHMTENNCVDTMTESVVQSGDTSTKSVYDFTVNEDNSKLDLRKISNFDAANRGGKKKKWKWVFSMKNRYAYHCKTCDKDIAKIRGDPMKTHCDDCKKKLSFRCLSCKSMYKSYFGVYVHLKDKLCSGLTNKDAEKTSNVLNSSMASGSGFSEQLESTDVEESIPSVAAASKGTTPNNEQTCPDCGEIVVNGNGPCEGKQLFQCFTCTFRSCHKSTLIHHIKSLHSDAKSHLHTTGSISKALIGKVLLHCNNCNHTTPVEKTSTRSNCELCSSPMYFVCINCEKQYTNTRTLRIHLLFDCDVQPVQPRFQCHKCDYKTNRKDNLQTHIEKKHSTKKCRGCGEIFNNYIGYRAHLLSATKCKISYRCKYCDFTSKLITLMKDHVRLEHSRSRRR